MEGFLEGKVLLGTYCEALSLCRSKRRANQARRDKTRILSETSQLLQLRMTNREEHHVNFSLCLTLIMHSKSVFSHFVSFKIIIL